MAAVGLLALIDDIATLLDDVALLSKVAAKKTAGVLGDDLALNAQQVSGVKADRELAVVWAVAKGSVKNKLILVPAALLISAFIPWLVLPLLMLGGAYLCYEGFEKVCHSLHRDTAEEQRLREQKRAAISDTAVDMVAFEKDKIRGAIRTDFILSAEIVVITLGTVKAVALTQQILVVSIIAAVITIVVYGTVAAIVKLDDAGLYLQSNTDQSLWGSMRRWLGGGILAFCPYLMKTLGVVGTVAMFLVGGGILAHGVPSFYEWLIYVEHLIAESLSLGMLDALLPTLVNGLVGVVAGGLIYVLMAIKSKILPSGEH
jgi:predicted DNA repair protein MutK